MATDLPVFLFLSFTVYLLFIVAIILLGKFIIRILRTGTFGLNSYFIYSLTGFIAFIIFYSLFYTKVTGSINLVLLILLVYWVVVIRKKQYVPVYPAADEKRSWPGILILAVIVFAVNLLLRLNVEEWPFFKAGKDEIFYSLVTKFISNKHIESSSIDWYAFEGAVSLRPYHYIEQWSNLFFSQCFSFSSLGSMYFIVMPVFFFITVCGLLSILDLYSSLESGIKYILAFVLCFWGFPAISMNEGGGIWMNSPIPGNLKYLPLFWITFLLIHLLKNKQWNWFFALIPLFPLFNYGLLPIALVFLMIYTGFFNYLSGQKRNSVVFISYIISIAGIPLMVKLGHSPDFQGQYDQKLGEVFGYYSGDLLFSKIKLIAGMGWFYLKAVLLSSLIPFMLIGVLHFYLKLRRKEIYNSSFRISVLLIAVLIAGLSIAAILNFMLDAYQIFYLAFQIISGAVLTMLIITFIVSIKKRISMLVILGSLIICFAVNVFMKAKDNNSEIFSRYDSKYRSEMKIEFMKRYDGGAWTGLRFMSPEYYENVYQIQSTDQYEGFPFVYLTDETHLFTVNTDAAKVKKEDAFGIYQFAYERYSKIEYFNCWAKNNNFNLSDSSDLLAAQLKFIDAFKVNFIVIQKGVVLPDEISKLVEHEIVSSVNSERICFLKRG
jgi:hypothetical protein